MEYRLNEAQTQFSKAVWCPECCLRIAPYDLRTVVNGKDYHRHCFQKIVRQGRGLDLEVRSPREDN